MKLKKKLGLMTCLSVVFFCAGEVTLLVINEHNKNAAKYSGDMYPACGGMQLELLKKEGLMPHHYVYEIGCGVLMSAIPIMSYLDSGHYVAIEPNKWQIDQSLRVEANNVVAQEKQPQFFYGTDFDVTASGIVFDYIFAHSIMSHAPLWQLCQFLEKCFEQLKDGGKVIFSLRLTQPNIYSQSPVQIESVTNEWQYPGNTFFHRETVEREALKWFKKVDFNIEFTKLITSVDRSAFHDWCIVTK